MSTATDTLNALATARLADSTSFRHDARDHYRAGTRAHQELIARAQLADTASGVLLGASAAVKRAEDSQRDALDLLIEEHVARARRLQGLADKEMSHVQREAFEGASNDAAMIVRGLQLAKKALQ